MQAFKYIVAKRYSPTWGWCGGSNMQLLVGDLNGDGRSDILCHRLSDGYKYIAYATRWGHITKENWQGNHQKCDGEFLLGMLIDSHSSNLEIKKTFYFSSSVLYVSCVYSFFNCFCVVDINHGTII